MVVSVDDRLIVAFNEGMIHIFLEMEKKGTSNRPKCAENLSLHIVLPHPKSDHLENVTEIGFRRKLGFFCTSSVDGFIKTWTAKNMLMREMKFNQPLKSVCMINNQADILFPVKNRIQIISGQTRKNS